jgi:hypothetical protein
MEVELTRWSRQGGPGAGQPGRVCSDVTVPKKLFGLALLWSLLASCSSGSSTAPPRPSPAATHPLGVTLADIQHFFNGLGASQTGWVQGGPEETSGPLHGMDTYTGGGGELKLDVIGNPNDETEMSVVYTIATTADATKANAVILSTVREFAPGAGPWIRGALRATDGPAGYFGGSSATDTSGPVALTFSTGNTKVHDLVLTLAGGTVTG